MNGATQQGEEEEEQQLNRRDKHWRTEREINITRNINQSLYFS